MAYGTTGGTYQTKQGGIVVERGGEDDPRPSMTKAGEMVVRLPGVHGDGVDSQHLALVAPEKPLSDQCIFPGVPDYGSTVGASCDPGSSRVIAQHIWGGVNNSQDGMPGNINLFSALAFLFTKQSGRNAPARWEEVDENGVRVRKIRQERPYLSEDTSGLPNHMGNPEMMGFLRLPQVKNIPTAVQAFSNILTNAQTGNLAGIVMNIGTILATVLSNQKHYNAITSSMPAQTVTALNNIAKLSATSGVLATGGSTTGIRIDPDHFSANAAALLSQCKTPADIFEALNELSSNTTYFGLAEEDLILNLDASSGNGDFLIGDTIYQPSDVVPGVNTVPIGQVIKWNSQQKELTLKIQNDFAFNVAANVFTFNTQSPAGYNVNTYTYFATTSNVASTTTNAIYGSVTTSVDYFGNVYNKPSNEAVAVAAGISAIMSLASLGGGAMSADLDKPVFGDAAGDMMQMLNRLPPEVQSARMSTFMKAQNEDIRSGQRQQVIGGGNPLQLLPGGGGLGGVGVSISGLGGLLSGSIGSLYSLIGIPGLGQALSVISRIVSLAQRR